MSRPPVNLEQKLAIPFTRRLEQTCGAQTGLLDDRRNEGDEVPGQANTLDELRALINSD